MTEEACAAPLHLLAIDHRVSLLTGMGQLQAQAEVERSRTVAELKQVVLDGLLGALAGGAAAGSAGILVDTQYGSDVARRARAHGLHVGLPVERSGQRELAIESFDGIPALVDALDPTFLKALVRYNPGGDAAVNARQRRTLGRLAAVAAVADTPLMLELLVPAEPSQLEAVGGEVSRYDDEMRPELTVRAITDIREDGILPAVWKVEGLARRADCEAVAAVATDGGRLDARCVVLGRGADRSRVEEWLRIAAPVRGFAGFAVGRSIWWDSIERLLAGSTSRAAAVAEIAAAYTRMVDVHQGALV